MNSLFGWKNWLLSATALVVSSEAPGLTAGNLQTQQGAPSEAWQTQAGVTNASLLIDMGATASWRAFLLARTNLSPAAKVRWRVGAPEAFVEAVPTIDAPFGPGFVAPDGFSIGRSHTPSTALATYFDSTGTMQTVGPNVLRYDTYNPATLESVGALMELSRTNYILDPRGENNAANWARSSVNSVVGTGVEDGIPYVDIRWQGASAISAVGVTFNASNLSAAAVPGEVWSGAVNVRLVAGTLPTAEGESLVLRHRSVTSANAFAGSKELSLAPTNAPLRTQRFENTKYAIPTNAAGTNLVISATLVGAFDFTLRLALPQLEKGDCCTSVVLPPAGSPQVSTRGTDIITIASQGRFAARVGTIAVDASIVSAPAAASVSATVWSALVDNGVSSGTSFGVRTWSTPTGIFLDAYMSWGGVVLADFVNTTVPGVSSGSPVCQIATLDSAGFQAWANSTVFPSDPDPAPDTDSLQRIRIQSGGGGTFAMRRFRYYATPLTRGQSAALASTGSTLDATTTTYDSGELTGVVAGYGQLVNIAPAEVAGRCARVDISDPANPDGFLNVPLAYAGPVWSPQVNIAPGGAVGRDRDATVVRTRSGGEFVSLRSSRRRWAVSLLALTSAEAWLQVADLEDAAADGRNILLVPFPDGAHVQREAVFGLLASSNPVTLPTPNVELRTWSATITERL
jgi:hypothetical protein